MDDINYEKLRTLVAAVHEVDPGGIWTRFGAGLLQLHYNGRKLTPNEVAKAAKAALVLKALDDIGTCKGTARELGISRATVYRISKKHKIRNPPKICETLPVSQFDERLFPFVRTHWDASPTPASITEWRKWMLGTIVPRAVEEGKKIVMLDDCSAWGGLPPLTVITKAQSTMREVQGLVSQHALGAVVFVPNMAWATWFNPLLDVTRIAIKIASTPAQAINFAVDYFQGAGVIPPANMAVN